MNETPKVELPAPQHLADLLKLWEEKTIHDPTSELWQDWIGEDADKWHAKNAELAAKALSGDDESLFKLIRRDSRYLGTQLVVARHLEAKIVLFTAKNKSLEWLLGDDPEGRQAFDERVEQAKKFLRDLGKAVAWNLGQGAMRSRYEPSDVLSLLRNQERVLKALWQEAEVSTASGPRKLRTLRLIERQDFAGDDATVAELAKKYGAETPAVVELLSSAEGAITEAAIKGTAAHFKIKPETVTKTRQRRG